MFCNDRNISKEVYIPGYVSCCCIFYDEEPIVCYFIRTLSATTQRCRAAQNPRTKEHEMLCGVNTYNNRYSTHTDTKHMTDNQKSKSILFFERVDEMALNFGSKFLFLTLKSIQPRFSVRLGRIATTIT